MISSHRTPASVVLLTLLWVLPAAGSDTPEEILEKVRKKYETIRDAELTFSQRVRFPASKLEQSAHGTLFLKKEHKYRIETEDQTIVTDGSTVWSYSVPNRQVLIDQFKQDERSLTPERILAGAPGEFAATVIGRDKLQKMPVIILKLVPRGEQSLVSALRLWIDAEEWVIRKAEVTDLNGKESTYTVEDLRINAGLPDSRFTFVIPEGVDVVDLR
ncbi:MAG: outer membrane lipoprotein carrier protein LolA [Bacteroidota bacterium]